MRLTTRKNEKNNMRPVDLHITEKKRGQLAAKYDRLKKSRPALVDEVQRLAKEGDFSENAAYQLAKAKLRGLNNSLLKLEHILNHAIIITPTNSGVVELGSSVVVSNKDGARKTFQILGSAETRPEAGIISHNSPIGQALLGRRARDVIKVKLKNREVEYKIITIN